MEKIVLTSLSCEKCHHQWFPRNRKAPKVCPKCKRRDWDKKK